MPAAALPHPVGTLDLATMGAAEALAHLLAFDDPPAAREIAEHLAGRAVEAARNGLELRRLLMPTRLAALQATVLLLKSFRGACALDKTSLTHQEETWFGAAERSLELQIRGEPFLSVDFAGTFPRWSDLSGSRPKDIRRTLESGRERSEALALLDLRLAFAPHAPPSALVDRLLGKGPSAGRTTWFDAFGLFLAWQFYSRRGAWDQFIGRASGGNNAAREEGNQLLQQILHAAKVVSVAFEPLLAAAPATTETVSIAGNAPSPMRNPEAVPSDLALAASAIAAATGCPEVAVRSMAHHLDPEPAERARAIAVLHQDAITARRCASELRLAGNKVLLHAAEAIESARWKDAEGALLAMAGTPGFSSHQRAQLDCWRVAVMMAAGNHLGAAQHCTKVLQSPAGLDEGTRHALQSSAAIALAQYSLAKKDDRFRALAERTAAALVSGAGEALSSDHLCDMVRSMARLSLAGISSEAQKPVALAAQTLAQALSLLKGAPDKHIELTALRAECLLRLAALEPPQKAAHLAAAEQAARAAVEELGTWQGPAPRGLRAEVGEVLGRVLVALGEAGGSDQQFAEAAATLDAAITDARIAMDPFRSGEVMRVLGNAHLRLANGETAKARLEAAVISYAQVLPLLGQAIDRVRLAHGLQDALVRLASGGLAEFRLRQALEALAVAESACPRAQASDEMGYTAMQRAYVLMKLRRLTKDQSLLDNALSEADRAVEHYRGINGPWRVFLALRTKAAALIEAGIDLESPELLTRGEAVYREPTSSPEDYRISPRDLCLAFIAMAEAADKRVEWSVEETAADSAADDAIASYRKALALAISHNFPLLRSSAESALKRLESRRAQTAMGPQSAA